MAGARRAVAAAGGPAGSVPPTLGPPGLTVTMATVSSSKEKRVPQDRPPPNNHRPSAGVTVANVVRGGLMGLAETVPGVSGGTVALVTGIYSRLIASAKHLTDVPRAVVLRSDWRAQIR